MTYISNKVTGTSDCTISDDFNQDFLNTNPMTVNEGPGFLGMTDWMFGEKIEDDADDGYLGMGVTSLEIGISLGSLVLKTGLAISRRRKSGKAS